MDPAGPILAHPDTPPGSDDDASGAPQRGTPQQYAFQVLQWAPFVVWYEWSISVDRYNSSLGWDNNLI